MRLPDTRGERAMQAVLAQLVEGRMADMQAGQSQVDRVIDGIGKAMLAGVVVLLVFAVGQKAVLATLTLGLFAAVASAAAGAALGFLFALPSSAGRVVVASAPAPAPAPAPPPGEGVESAGNGGAAQQATAHDIEDWFKDNTALERLSDWLVGAIIALSLANFEAWRLHLQQLAVDISKGMGIAGGEWGAPAGVIMAAYALMGFLGGYLWTRRYMVLELARAKREGRKEQYQDQLDAADVARRMASPANVQNVAPASVAPQAAAAQAQAASDAAVRQHGGDAALESAAALPPDPWSVVLEPGLVPGDPWAGKFGGQPAGGGFEIGALVRPVEGNPDLFGVDLTIVGRPGQRARLYLHPTFPDAIRDLQLDAQGRATQRLLAWGAFTVGVQFDTGQLRELNLGMLPSAPARFRAR